MNAAGVMAKRIFQNHQLASITVVVDGNILGLLRGGFIMGDVVVIVVVVDEVAFLAVAVLLLVVVVVSSGPHIPPCFHTICKLCRVHSKRVIKRSANSSAGTMKPVDVVERPYEE